MTFGYYKIYLYTHRYKLSSEKKNKKKIKKINNKESHYMVSHPETGSDSPIGLDRESGCDNNSPENLPLKFISQPFSFLFSFMSCTHTYRSRVPRCIWNALCHFQTIHANIFYMHILTKLTHINHVIQFTTITSKLAHMG